MSQRLGQRLGLPGRLRRWAAAWLAPAVHGPVSLHWFFTRLFWLSLAPLVLVAAWLACAQVQAVQARQAALAAQLAADLAADIEHQAAGRTAAMRTLAASPLLDDPARPQAVLPLALAFRRTLGDDLLLADADLQPHIDTTQPAAAVLAPLRGAAVRAAARQAIETGQPVVGDIDADARTGAPMLPTVVPVLRAGQAPRLLVVLTDLAALQHRLLGQPLPVGWGLALHDSRGALLAQHGWAPNPTDGAADAGLVQVQRMRTSHHSVTVSVAPQVYRAPVLAATLALAGAVLSASLLGLVGAHLASRRLGRMLGQLLQPDDAATPEPGVTEIAAIRRALAEAARRRDEGQTVLLASEARCRQLFHQSPLPQALVDESGRVVDLNQQFIQAFGYSLADLATLDDWSRLAFPDPAYRATVQARRQRARQQAGAGDVVDCGEYRVRCRDGQNRLVVVQLVMLGDQMLTSWTDVTAARAAADSDRLARAAAAEEQRRARLASLNLIEDALAARHRLEAANAALQDLTQAIEQSAQAVVITDRRARIDYVNAAFTRQTGYSRDEVIGQPARMLMTPQSLADTHQPLWAALRRGETWRGEFINRRRDGRLAVDAAIVTPLRDRQGGAVTRYMALLEDVTEQRRQGEELERHRHHLEDLVASRTAELEAARAASDAANLAKSAFLANMSHEIRTPLNAVIGLTHLQRLDQPTPTQRSRLDKIDAAAQHLLSIINDVLDLSKIEAGEMQLEQVDFALAPLLAGVRAMVAGPAATKGLALRVEIDAMPLWLRGDPTRLRQALLNYAANAVKFTAHGSVTLRVRLLGATPGGVQLRFEVQDTGIGIAADQLPRLFQPFAQADASTTRRFGGSGLGLAITRRLVQLMGGEVGASSQPGQGSSFWFSATLALGRGQVPAAPLDQPDDPAQRLRRQHPGARVLVVEDNPVNREVAEALLQVAGLRVDSVENGLLALDQLAHQAYDLVLMDMQLPEMDGLTATRAIRSNPALARLPVLAMTANAFADDRLACLAAGMSDFVPKPVNPADLYGAILRCLDSGAPLQLPAATAATPAVMPAATPTRAVAPAATSAGAPVPAPAAAPADLPAAAPLAAPVGAPALQAALAGLLGEGLPAALRRLRGDLPRLLRLLQQFVQHQRRHPERMAALLGVGEAAEAGRLAHDLKGAAATLGATQLADLADRLERALQPTAGPVDTTTAQALAQALQDEMHRLADGLARLRTPADAAA